MSRIVGREEQEELGVIRGPASFVPAVIERPLPPQLSPLSVVDTSAVWQPTESRQGRDSVSAQDRARAVNLRLVPVLALVGLLAVLAVIAYSLTLLLLGLHGAPFLLDRILVFLGVVAGLGLWAVGRLNRHEYEHSHAGIERLRIIEAAEIRKAEIQAEVELRRTAMEHYTRLLNSLDTEGGHALPARRR